VIVTSKSTWGIAEDLDATVVTCAWSGLQLSLAGP